MSSSSNGLALDLIYRYKMRGYSCTYASIRSNKQDKNTDYYFHLGFVGGWGNSLDSGITSVTISQSHLTLMLNSKLSRPDKKSFQSHIVVYRSPR
ncbi:hypothetical protein OIU85_021066 [Salix viminalis]|uniref:Uncharacterized protein n=1 Tax=Salix viminalis TaxID=40686 RepID=A0A9Q0UHQ7_SALVM|nr:hypothetical protein OIU85_021066 [Salix viminalis]